MIMLLVITFIARSRQDHWRRVSAVFRLTAIHWTHHGFAFLVFGLLGWVAIKAMRIDACKKAALNLDRASFAIGFLCANYFPGLATVDCGSA